MAEVEELRHDHNAELTVEGVVVNQYAGAPHCIRPWSSNCAVKACRFCRCT